MFSLHCRKVNPIENWLVSFATLGEGWHNFHHVFPWDYKASELGNNRINVTTHFLNFCARMGWAYDLKTVPGHVLKKRVERTGDGSHELWGWGDRDMTERDRQMTEIINKKAM
jgi:stearoyl-CoA desaturase (delta-9 desaturase)